MTSNYVKLRHFLTNYVKLRHFPTNYVKLRHFPTNYVKLRQIMSNYGIFGQITSNYGIFRHFATFYNNLANLVQFIGPGRRPRLLGFLVLLNSGCFWKILWHFHASVKNYAGLVEAGLGLFLV